MSPKARVRFAWCLLAASVVGYPLTALTVAKDEPHVVLALSWFAITLTAWDVVSTADVRAEQEED